jgi:hypothetical protein
LHCQLEIPLTSDEAWDKRWVEAIKDIVDSGTNDDPPFGDIECVGSTDVENNVARYKLIITI